VLLEDAAVWVLLTPFATKPAAAGGATTPGVLQTARPPGKAPEVATAETGVEAPLFSVPGVACKTGSPVETEPPEELLAALAAAEASALAGIFSEPAPCSVWMSAPLPSEARIDCHVERKVDVPEDAERSFASANAAPCAVPDRLPPTEP